MPDSYTEAITNAHSMLASHVDDETPIRDDIAIVTVWAHEATKHFDGNADSARLHIAGRLRLMGTPATIADVLAGVMVEYANNHTGGVPTKCRHCGKEIVWRDRLSVGKDAEGWYWDLGDEYCEKPGQTYHEPA